MLRHRFYKMKNKYIEYIIKNGINLQKNQIVEIVCSSYLADFISDLEHACLKFGASSVYVKYIDGNLLQQKINLDYKLFIDEEVQRYENLILKGFSRIIIQSPFLIPMTLNEDKKIIYEDCQKRLSFVKDYFLNNESSKTICLASNPYWAAKLRITEDELWNIIYKYAFLDNKIDNYLNYLDGLNIKSLHFKNKIGTNLILDLTSNFKFQGRYQYTKSNLRYQPNIPSLEIYTAPNKYTVNGVVYSTKPLYYYGNVIDNWYICFKNGKVSESKNLASILSLDPNLSYIGEIALCETHDNINYYSTLLNENTSAHLALGMAYKYGISDITNINECQYHIDLSFGSEDLEVTAITNDFKSITIMENGKFKYD